MWNRPRTWIVLAALSGVGLAGYFEPTHCVRGWLWGETFFDGRPSSYWRRRIDRWLDKYDSPQAAAQSLLVTADGVAEFDPFAFT